MVTLTNQETRSEHSASTSGQTASSRSTVLVQWPHPLTPPPLPNPAHHPLSTHTARTSTSIRFEIASASRQHTHTHIHTRQKNMFQKEKKPKAFLCVFFWSGGQRRDVGSSRLEIFGGQFPFLLDFVSVGAVARFVCVCGCVRVCEFFKCLFTESTNRRTSFFDVAHLFVLYFLVFHSFRLYSVTCTPSHLIVVHNRSG